MLTEFYEMMERDGYNMPYLESLEAEREPTMARSRQLVRKLHKARDLWSQNCGMLLDTSIQGKMERGCYEEGCYPE